MRHAAKIGVMNAIVISLSGLNACHLGCYGCEWIDTPCLDQFAAGAFVFDQCFSACLEFAAARLAWWSGDRQMASEATQPESLIVVIRSHGVHTALVRDTRDLCNASGVAAVVFDEVVDVRREPGEFAENLFASARAWLERNDGHKPFLLWVDCWGVQPPWPSPNAFEIAEEDDNPVASESEGDEPDDPANFDELVESPAAASEVEDERSVFAAIVSALDAQVGEFLEFARRCAGGDELLIVVTSDFGVDVSAPEAPTQLCEACVHVPLLLGFGSRQSATGRSRALVQSFDLLPTVMDAMQLNVPPRHDGVSVLPIVRSERSTVRDHLFVHGRGEMSLRTPDWYLIRSRADDASDADFNWRLYEKPADRWERNDVSKIHPDVLESLQTLLARSGP
jgi:arylsulfatase A-like enzyme